MNSMKLLLPIVCNVCLVILFYMLDHRTVFRQLSYRKKQCVIGVAFGAMAAFASEYGVPINGVIMNIRDAAPISAGLIFGAPAGMISGFVGGLYRWVSVAWGAGTYTRLACAVSTVLSGLIAAGLRTYMFDDKKPTWGYGICITVVCEVLHMLMIFVTNMDDASHAFLFVKQCTLPMVVANAVAVGVSILVVTLLSREMLSKKYNQEHIAQTFQRWLLLCIVVAYLVTSLFNYQLQNSMSRLQTQAVLTQALEDVDLDIKDASDKNLLELARIIKKDYEAGTGYDSKVLHALAEKYDISEINIIDKDGIILGSTEAMFIGYDMSRGEQSAVFRNYLQQKEEYVQEYGPTSYDKTLYRKYAGIRLQDGGFILVGYDAERFQKDIDTVVMEVIKNRHIGLNGFIIACDKQLRLLTQDALLNGKYLEELGIHIDGTMKEQSIYEANMDGTSYLFSYATTEGYCIIGVIPKTGAMFMRDASLYTSAFMEILIFVLTLCQ